MAATIFGSLLDWASNQNTNWSNANNVYNTNMANREIARETNATNMALNQANIEMQERQNQINREREDDAVRRRANDLIGAGLSKTLAAGSPASANAMQAPQNTIAAQTGAPMQAYKATAYQGFETAFQHRMQNQIADKELTLKDKQLDETIRHNEVTEQHEQDVLDEEKNFHKLQDKWKFYEYNQQSQFHNDAMKLSWAQTKIDYLSYLNEVDKTELQNMWWSGQLELEKAAGERDAARLTAQLAESEAKVASYLKDIELSDAQIKLLEKEGKLMFSEYIRNGAATKNLNAQTKSIIIDNWSKAWNLMLSVKGRSKTTNVDVSPAQATENALDRKSNMRRTLITAGAGAVGVALGAFGIGAKGLLRKAFGEDRFDISYSVK